MNPKELNTLDSSLSSLNQLGPGQDPVENALLEQLKIYLEGLAGYGKAKRDGDLLTQQAYHEAMQDAELSDKLEQDQKRMLNIAELRRLISLQRGEVQTVLSERMSQLAQSEAQARSIAQLEGLKAMLERKQVAQQASISNLSDALTGVVAKLQAHQRVPSELLKSAEAAIAGVPGELFVLTQRHMSARRELIRLEKNRKKSMYAVMITLYTVADLLKVDFTALLAWDSSNAAREVRTRRAQLAEAAREATPRAAPEASISPRSPAEPPRERVA